MLLPLLLGQGSGGGGGPGPLTFGSAQGNNGVFDSTTTFTALTIGTAASDRWVIVAFHTNRGYWDGSSSYSVTIGGVAATLLYAGTPDLGNDSGHRTFWKALVPSGTTANVVLTLVGGVMYDASAATYYCTGEPVFSAGSSDNTYTGSTFSTTIDVPDGGAVIAVAGRDGSESATFAGVTGDALNVDRASFGSEDQLSAQTGRTVSATFPTSGGSADYVGLAVLAVSIPGTGGGPATGSGAGTLGLTGAATGTAIVAGAGAGAIGLTGASAGAVRVAGTSSGALGLTGAATGVAPATGTATGSIAITGSGTGTVAALGGVSGDGAGSLGLTGAASGYAIPAGRWVSQTGNNANPGTYDLPYATIQYGWSQCAAGETLWVKDDLTPTSFSSSSTGIILTANGTAGNPITLRGWPVGTRRVINLTNHTHGTTGGTGIRVVANYAVLRDLHITEVKAPLRSAPYVDGVNWRGTDGQFLNCEISQVEGRGLTISESGLATNLLVQNCDIHDCFDPRSASPYGDADGIQVFNATIGVIIEKCRIWRCADDGIDMFFQTQPVTIRDNWIWKAGFREDGVTAGGDGTGIKTGSATRSANHIIQRNLVFDCRVWGIGGNDSTTANTWSYNTVIDTPTAYESFTAGVAHVLTGNAKYGGTNSFTGSEVRNRNSFDTPPGITESAAWFVSLSRTGVDAARAADGTLPMITFGYPAPGGDLVGNGPSGTTIGAFDVAGTVSSVGTAAGSLGLAGAASGAARAAGAGSGSLAIVGSGAGVAPILAAASGTLSLTGSGAGTAPVTGTASGPLALAGTGAGVARVAGASAGSMTLSGSAVGVSPVAGAAAGSLPIAGSSSGAASVVAAAAGVLPLAGSSSGAASVFASAAGELPLAGSGTGVVASAGSVTGAAAGSLPLTGVGAGAARADGSAAGSLPMTGAGTGAARVSGNATGTLPMTGEAVGAARAAGNAAGSLPMTGAGVGAAPVAGIGLAALPLSGAANGLVVVQGAGAGSLSLSVLALGAARSAGTGAGAMPFAGSGAGEAPLPLATPGRIAFAALDRREGTILNAQPRQGDLLVRPRPPGNLLNDTPRQGAVLNPTRRGQILEID